MKDTGIKLRADLAGLSKEAWLDQVEELADDLGSFEPLGASHCTAFIDAGPKLLVTFEDADAICAQGGPSEPAGFTFVRENGWSHLAIISHSESWFRDPAIYRHFDRLIDDGFFEDFDNVLFYGCGAGGYAAAAYSVAAPNCAVLALRPQATLDPRVAGFDPRFRNQRRSDFTSRYGYAPDMIDAVNTAYIAFDPIQKLDAMHAALFTRNNVKPLRCGHFGPKLEQVLVKMQVLNPMIRAAMTNELSDQVFSDLMRARRNNETFRRTLLRTARRTGHGSLAADYCAAVLRQAPNPFFAKQLEELELEGHTRPGPTTKQAAE